MLQLEVGLKESAYPVYINSGGLAQVGERLQKKQFAKRYAIIADETVANLYGQKLQESLKKAGVDNQLFTFPAGEKSKSLQMVGELASMLVAAGFVREDGIIGFGGGVSGDLAGFLAASYMRGVPFIQVPTTLLAQVDSSVGGKTGVDLPEGKNLLGAFYQPKAVYIDIDLLQTLPAQEFLGGLAEVIKYGVVCDGKFFSFLREKKDKIFAQEENTLIKMIARCIEIKAEVVAEDEKEGGLRRILNFGHTIGHAVEGASHYSMIHGLAVAIGMAAATKLAVTADVLEREEGREICSLLTLFGLPQDIPKGLDRGEIDRYLHADKKVAGGKVVYVLPTAIGAATITDTVTEGQLVQVLNGELSL